MTMTEMSAGSRTTQTPPPPSSAPPEDNELKLPWNYSFIDISRYLKAYMLAEKINASIDDAGFRGVIAQHSCEGYGSYKYFDKKLWLRAKTMRAIELRLNKREPSRVLDLGCGPGYFLYVCKWLGHHVQGLDLPDEDFYRNMMGFFAIPRADFRIEPHIELPKFPEKFDVVSAHQICFNGHKTSQLWGAPEWDFFIDDLRRHHLKPGGVIALEFNPEPAVGYYSHKLRDLFAAHGAEMVRGRVTIPI